jgi:hypothetical protein
VGFSIGTSGYLGTGWDSGYNADFYEYNPGTNIWTAKVNIPLGYKVAAVGYSIGTKGYITTGMDGGNYKTTWEYCP